MLPQQFSGFLLWACRDFINPFSRRTTGFHRQAKLFKMKLLLTGQTRQAILFSQLVKLPGARFLLKSLHLRCMTFADCRLSTANPQTADCRLQTADRRPQTADCRLQTAEKNRNFAMVTSSTTLPHSQVPKKVAWE